MIVGAGAAGCLVAAKLAAEGHRVTVLEAGPEWNVGDLWSSQIWSRRLKWRGPPVQLTGANPIAFNLIMGSGIGGAALHHYGTWPRFTADVFGMASEFGSGLDWPYRYETLQPYYDRVQREVGISGDAIAESWRPPGEPYPMPGMRAFRHADLLRDGFRRLGLAVAPLPAAINSTDYNGRAACLYDGWCDAGCPIGALGNPLFTYHLQAVTAGAEFRAQCQVTRITSDRSGRATGVEYVAGEKRESLRADVIILAASVVENPRLLLNSATPAHPRGLGNSSGLVGRHVMAEIMAFAYGMFGEPVDNHLGVSAGSYMHRSPVRNPALPGVAAGHQWQIGPALKPNDIFGIAVTRPDLFGTALDAFIRRASREMGYMVGFGGGTPAPDNAITLAGESDRFGMPRAKVTHRFTDAQQRLWAHMNEEGARVLAAAGAKEQWHGPLGAGHLIGGTVIGSKPAASVADVHGTLHDVPNIHLTGAGLFPSSGGQSPTFTLLAMAARTVDHILGRSPPAPPALSSQVPDSPPS